MRVFNTIQVTVLTMLSPIFLTWLYSAKFVGSGAVFWVSVGGTVALALWVGSMIHELLSFARNPSFQGGLAHWLAT